MNDPKLDYRARVYRHYLATQLQADLRQLPKILRLRAPYLKRLIHKWMPQDRNVRILDLGCGYGAFLYFLREAGYINLEGIDASMEQIQAARRLGLVSVRQGEVLDVLRESHDCSYHVIIAFDVLEHFTKQEILTITDEAYRVLCKGGRLILHLPNGEAIFSGRSHFSDLTHELSFTRQSIRQLTSLAGFAHVSFDEDVPVIHGIVSGVRHLLWKLFRTIFRLIYAAETGDIGRDLALTQNLLAVVWKSEICGRNSTEGLSRGINRV